MSDSLVALPRSKPMSKSTRTFQFFEKIERGEPGQGSMQRLQQALCRGIQARGTDGRRSAENARGLRGARLLRNARMTARIVGAVAEEKSASPRQPLRLQMRGKVPGWRAATGDLNDVSLHSSKGTIIAVDTDWGFMYEVTVEAHSPPDTTSATTRGSVRIRMATTTRFA